MSRGEFVDAALYYSSMGICVHALSSPKDTRAGAGKIPVAKGWNKMQTPAPDDQYSIAFGEGSDFNIGVVTGKASGITVLDFDSLLFYDTITEGVDTSNWWFSSRAKDGEKVGRGHVIFQYVPDLPGRKSGKFAKEIELSGIDILNDDGRGGGNNCVFPPSRHKDGGTYHFNREIKSRDDIPVMPEVVKERVRRIIELEHELISCIGRSRRWIKELLSDPVKLHGGGGRRCMLAMTAELRTVGLSDGGVHFLSRVIYQEDYDKDRTTSELSHVEGMFWKSETLCSNFPEYCNPENTGTTNEWRTEHRPRSGEPIVGEYDDSDLAIVEIFGEKAAGIHMPQPWVLSRDGVYRMVKEDPDAPPKRTYLSSTPFLVTARGDNIDTGEQFIEVSCLTQKGKVRSMIISLKDALCKSTVTSLIGSGILFTDKGADSITNYLKGCIEDNPDLPEIVKIDANGWKHAGELFVCGRTGYTIDGEIEVIPSSPLQADGLGPHGDLRAWCDGMREALAMFPTIRFKMYTALAVPLLRKLRAQSFIQDHYGESGSGKSSSSDLALSVWGDPDKLRFNGDTTKTAAEHVAAMMCDLPLYLDETGTQAKADVLSSLVYMIANEQGRMRGKKDGGLRDLSTWKTIAMTTGEKAVVNEDGFTGQIVRVMPITSKLTADGSMAAEITKAVETVKKHSGHIGALMIRKILQEEDRAKELMKEIEKRFSKDGEGSVTENRMVRQFAVITVSGYFVEEIFSKLGIDPIDPEQLVREMMLASMQTKNTEAYAIRGLRIIMDWRQTYNQHFMNIPERSELLEALRAQAQKEYEENYDPNKVKLSPFPWDIYGFLNGQYLDVVPDVLRNLLEKRGISSKRIIAELADIGVVHTPSKAKSNPKEGLTYRIRPREELGQTCTRVYRIDTERAEAVIKAVSGEEDRWVDNR